MGQRVLFFLFFLFFRFRSTQWKKKSKQKLKWYTWTMRRSCRWSNYHPIRWSWMHSNWPVLMFRSRHDGRVISFGWIWNWKLVVSGCIVTMYCPVQWHTYHDFSLINYAQHFPSNCRTSGKSSVAYRAVVTGLCFPSLIWMS